MRIHHLVLAVLLAATCAACGVAGGDASSAGGRGFVVAGYVHAGPACPVVQDPPESGCLDRAVAGALLLVTDTAGSAVTSVRSAADGTFEVVLPSGRYVLVPQPVEGLLGTASQKGFQLIDLPIFDLDVSYDTGIR